MILYLSARTPRTDDQNVDDVLGSDGEDGQGDTESSSIMPLIRL
jgi:hypothetical protein